MRIFDELKTMELFNPDLTKGRLIQDRIVIKHHEERKAVKELFHFETVGTYPNGGKVVKRVIDVQGVTFRPAYDETEDVLIYIPYTEKELKDMENDELRKRREVECYAVINRGKLWYNTLTSEEEIELTKWYNAWKDVTETKVIPERPKFIDEKLIEEVI